MDKDIKCLDCGEKIVGLKKGIVEGDVIECEACGAEHELVKRKPMELMLIEEEK